MWRKRETGDWTSPRTLDIQKLLDTSVYSEECLSVYESVIGDGFVTPMGLSATNRLLSKVSLTPQTRVLDVGCGLGGTMAYRVKDFPEGVKAQFMSTWHNLIGGLETQQLSSAVLVAIATH